MNKFSKIAVFIRGHIRLWKYINANIFHNYSIIADQVDYYVAVWQTDTMSFQEIKNTFDGQNLIALIEPPLQAKFSGPWYSQGWMPYNLLPYKKMQEDNYGQYDAVFDQRTDVVLDFSKHINFENLTAINDNVLYSMWPCYPKAEITEVKDFGFYSTSGTFNILTERFAVDIKPIPTIETQLFNWLRSKKIKVEVVNNYIQADVIRPNYLVDNYPFVELRINDPVKDSWAIWNKTLPEEKLKILSAYGIDVEDYFEKIYEAYET